MARGALWMSVLRMSIRGIGLVSTVILARLLVPADFGLVAMATSILAFLQLATAFGFDTPLIQNQQADRSHFDSAWTLNVAFYTALTIVLVLLADSAAAFYQDPRLTNVIYVLGAGFLVQGFENIGIVQFRKELDFRKDFIMMLSKKLAGFLVTIPLAFVMRSYWALVVGMVLGNALSVLLSYLLHPFRPRFSVSALGELFRFSRWLMLNNIINFLRMRSPDFVIGRMFGTSSLGLFSVAYEISTLPTTELVAPINRAVFPGYSKIGNDPALLGRSYLDVLAMIATIAVPAGFGIAAVAAPLVDLVLGSKWGGAAPIVGILAVYGGIDATCSNTGYAFNAIGKPYLGTLIGLINAALLLTLSISLALIFGAIGVAVGYLSTAVLIAPLVYWHASRQLSLRYRDVLGVIWRPVLCSIFMYCTILSIDMLQLHHPSWFRLLLLVPLGVAVYSVLMFLLWVAAGRPKSAEYRVAMLVLAKIKGTRAELTPTGQ